MACSGSKRLPVVRAWIIIVRPTMLWRALRPPAFWCARHEGYGRPRRGSEDPIMMPGGRRIQPDRGLRRPMLHHQALIFRIVPAGLLMALMAFSPATGEERTDCAAAPPVLWGDGAHD